MQNDMSEHHEKWKILQKKHCPHESDFWAESFTDISIEQGWKIHISATSHTAATIFSALIPVIKRYHLPFKIVKEFKEIEKINCGLYYGYSQIGKVFTIYLIDETIADAVALDLTSELRGYQAPTVPSDIHYALEAPVYYRYGAFKSTKTMEINGITYPAISSPSGELFADERTRTSANPPFVRNPFTSTAHVKPHFTTPLSNQYLVYEALSQRGKGGVYRALDISGETARLCIVKEGRHTGEVIRGQFDGRDFIHNEKKFLLHLYSKGVACPQVYGAFSAKENEYLAMENINGNILFNEISGKMLPKNSAVILAKKVVHLISGIVEASTQWRDCKPQNIIIKDDGELAPIDFEGALFTGEKGNFPWGSRGYYPSEKSLDAWNGYHHDIYAMAVIVYQLLSNLIDPGEQPMYKWPQLHSWVPSNFADYLNHFIAGDTEMNRNCDEFMQHFSTAFSST